MRVGVEGQGSYPSKMRSPPINYHCHPVVWSGSFRTTDSVALNRSGPFPFQADGNAPMRDSKKIGLIAEHSCMFSVSFVWCLNRLTVYDTKQKRGGVNSND